MSPRNVAFAAVAVAATVFAAAASASAAGKPYQSTTFKPPFTVSLPAGWIVAERFVGGAQMWKRCSSCPYDGEVENGEVTLDMALARLSLSRAIKLLHGGISGVAVGPVRPISIGTLRGLGFTARRSGAEEAVFPRSGYHTTTGPLQVWVVRGAGKTVTVIQDPPANARRSAAFWANAKALLKTLRFPT